MPTLNLLPPGDANQRAARRLADPPDALLVIAHGTPEQVAGENAVQLATRIQACGVWRPGMPVRLDACRAGARHDGVAAQLAQLLGCEVWAPTAPLLNLGRWRIGPWHGLRLPGQRALGLWPGRWRCFRP
jgi:hypothetical protein